LSFLALLFSYYCLTIGLLSSYYYHAFAIEQLWGMQGVAISLAALSGLTTDLMAIYCESMASEQANPGHTEPYKPFPAIAIWKWGDK
jgi:hypothetical protein